MLRALSPAVCIALVASSARTEPVMPDEDYVDPFPRAVLRTELLERWDFARGEEGWRAVNQCSVSARVGVLEVVSTGGDPYIHSPRLELEAPSAVVLRMRGATGGPGQVFWTTAGSPAWDEKKSSRFALVHDGEWHEYRVPVDVQGALTGLRLDPGAAPGRIEIDRVELWKSTPHPLEIARLETGAREVAVHVRNHSPEPIDCSVCGRAATVPGGGVARVVVDASGEAPFAAFTALVTAKGLPALARTAYLHRPEAAGDWIVRRSGGLVLRVARDGSGARLEREGRLAAVIAPIVRLAGEGTAAIPRLGVVEQGPTVRLRGEGVEVALSLAGDEVSVTTRAEFDCEGPVLRAVGPLEQGLFAGLEYLGRGESSSSRNDIETEERLRFAPDPLKVTMPLMACVTDRGCSAMTWEDMSLRPVFAAPNFFDGTSDHLMALRGRNVRAAILCRPVPLEEAILWAARRKGLPPLPTPPRETKEQLALYLEALEGPLRTEKGWGHCAESNWERRWFADHASTIWRLTGRVPEVPELVPGGAHVPNDSIYFVTGRAREYLAARRRRVEDILREQRPDGSFRYQGKYLRGHFEDTASGHCARPAAELLEFARQTGDARALDAGLGALEYTRRFRTPRGAQVWELSLHTPDILASAYLVWAYVRGYELTGRREYLAEARRWALSGVPFVYLWGRYPVMAYSTIAVYGATNWRAPNWIGLPVQWCGGVYAYALAMLAPHEDTLDWAHLARGILLAGEQMTSAGGEFPGCLPDSWELASQTGRPPMINPCALVSLRLALDGALDSLAVAVSEGEGGRRRRVLSPFPVRIEGAKALISARAGASYQIVVDGERVIDVRSRGTDVVPLD